MTDDTAARGADHEFAASESPIGERPTSARPMDAPARPGTVKWGLGILWVGVVLTPIVLLIVLVPLLSTPQLREEPALRAQADGVVFSLVLTFAIVAVQAVLLVFAGRGRSWARMVLAVLSGISIVAGLVSGQGVQVGTLLTIVAIVLLFLPASSEWFRAMEHRR